MSDTGDYTITGNLDFLRLSKALKKAGRTDMRKGLHQALQRAAKPLIAIDRAAAAELLPKAGGLNVRMAKAPQRVRVKTGRDPGISLELPGKQKSYSQGVVRHPVFERDKANRKAGNGVVWLDQSGLNTEWFDGTLREAAPRIVLPAIAKAVDDVARQIVREAHL